jgi:hypothetical protein
MYEPIVVRAKLDGLGERVCYYRQGKGMCTGVAMEWIRRLLMGDSSGDPQPSLYPKMAIGKDKDFLTENQTEILAKLQRKDAKREHAQKVIYDKARNAFASDVEQNGKRHKCLAALSDLSEQWEAASLIVDPNKRHMTKGQINKWATQYSMALPPQGVDKKVIATYLEQAYDEAYDHDYREWRKTEPIEVGVFKEYSEEVERLFFDDDGRKLRARFKEIKVVESADSLKIHTKTAAEAVELALRNQQFTDDRALVFGILGKDIAHSLGLYNSGEGNYLWMDPNYGVWSMEQPSIVASMKYLFDATGKPEEAGVYQVNGGGTPTGFEYSVWDLRI